MSGLMRRIQTRRNERKARRLARIAHDHVPDGGKLAAQVRQRREMSEMQPGNRHQGPFIGP
jgi:hypothetical protein